MTITTDHIRDGVECDCPFCSAVRLAQRMRSVIARMAHDANPCPVCRVVRSAIEARLSSLEILVGEIADADDPKQAAQDNHDIIDIMATMLDLDVDTLEEVVGAAHQMLPRRVLRRRPPRDGAGGWTN